MVSRALPSVFKKTQVQHGNVHVPTAITIGSAHRNLTSYYFKEHVFTGHLDVDDEITHCLAKAASAFSMWSHQFWNERSVQLRTVGKKCALGYRSHRTCI